MAVRWSHKRVRNKAYEYTTRRQFQKEASGAYYYASTHGMIDSICSHMPLPANYPWTVERLRKKALTCTTRKEFIRCGGAYNASVRFGIYDDICSHMDFVRMYWTDVELHKEASKYTTRKEFENCCNGGYQVATNRGILDDVCKHMVRGVYGFNPEKSAVLYYLKVVKAYGVFYKIGITNRTVRARYNLADYNDIEIIYTKKFDRGIDAQREEKRITSKFQEYQYKGIETPLSSATGNTEIFISDINKLSKEY